MEVQYSHCCGLDVHKKTVAACLLVTRQDGTVVKEVKTFGTMTDDLLALSDWLMLYSVTQVAMESTGVYWKPIYNILEGSVELFLVNAQHIKAVPGRKTDVRDCEWIADLLRHGLLTASFVPDQPQRELRELTRYRTTLVRERAAEVNRLHKTLEGANIKLGDVASDILGVSGRQMLEQIVGGTNESSVLAQLAKGKLRAKIPELERALAGRVRAHQRFMIAQQLAHIDYLDEAIERVSEEVEERVRPFQEAIERLDTIPGIDRRAAQALVAEIGVDMDRFPTERHLASWAGMAPGNNESAGKRRSGKTRKGSPWLRSILVEAAHAAGRTKATYLAAQYRRLTVRRGRKRAAIAVGHTILVIAYHLIQGGTTYHDLGPLYFDQRDRERLERRLIQRLEALGNKITIEHTTTAA